jgi:hypothetical protein
MSEHGLTVTLNLGWIGEGSVFLVSDTSATRKGVAQQPLSSLGQNQQRPDGVAVEESVAKLVPLGSHAVAALCGDARGATLLVRDVLRRLGRGTSLHGAILESGHSLYHHHPPFGGFSILVAEWDSGPRLLRYDSQNLALANVTDHGVVFQGSLGKQVVDRIRKEIEGLPKPPVHGQVVLGAALAILQGIAASEDLVRDSVAGIFYGLQIDADGVHWQPNMLYVFHQKDRAPQDDLPLHIVGCRILDGLCTVGSSLNRAVNIFVPAGDTTDRSAWMTRWQDSLGTEAALQMSKLIAFIRVTGGSVVILPNDQQHFRYVYDDGLQFAFSPELDRRLRWKPTADRPCSYSLGLPAPKDP